jgi:hypothetical protein
MSRLAGDITASILLVFGAKQRHGSIQHRVIAIQRISTLQCRENKPGGTSALDWLWWFAVQSAERPSASVRGIVFCASSYFWYKTMALFST